MLLTASAGSSLSLEWQKINGFKFRSGINGEWTITPLLTDNTTAYVEFYFDDELKLNSTTTPFSWTFNTAYYTEGNHLVEVVAYNSVGETAVATEEQNFVGFPFIFIIGVVLFCSIVFAFVLLVTWYIIKEKAQARRIARQSSSCTGDLSPLLWQKKILNQKAKNAFVEPTFFTLFLIKKEKIRN